MSVRVRRWDTGLEIEVQEDSLRWGPDTKQGTCRAALLRPVSPHAGLGLGVVRPECFRHEDDVPYLLPFSGAKWAVRVDWSPIADPPYQYSHPPRPSWASSFTDPDARQRLRSLLEAAEEALVAERGSDPFRCAFCMRLCASSRPSPLGDAGVLLARILDEAAPLPRALAAEVRAFLEREEDRPDALGEALELLAEALGWLQDSEDFPKERAFRRKVVAFLERETSAEIRREWKGAERG